MKPPVVIVMGVCGAGKSLIGRGLSEAWSATFDDADDYHLPENREKLAAGIPLSDEDRRPWYAELRRRIVATRSAGRRHVMACSALHTQLRSWLREDDAPESFLFILLESPREVIAQRMAARHDHFMPASLLDSQLATLEITADLHRVSNHREPQSVIAEIRALLP